MMHFQEATKFFMKKLRKLQITFVDNLFLGRPIVVFYQGKHKLANKLIIVCLWKKEKVCQLLQKEDKQSVMANLSIFLKMKNTKTVFVQYIKIYYRTIFYGE